MNSVEQKLLALKFEVIRLVNEMPDFVYYPQGGRCSYTRGGCISYKNRGCLIGQAAKNIDYGLYSVMKSNDMKGIGAILAKAYRLDYSARCYKLEAFFIDVQMNQDNRCPWIECV
jgi:hypothetical protein